jgi:hypothetical protein
MPFMAAKTKDQHEIIVPHCFSGLALTMITSTFLLLSHLALIVSAQSDTLGIGNGYLTLETDLFSVELVKDSQTLASLRPKILSTFDFLPFDYLISAAIIAITTLATLRFHTETSGKYAGSTVIRLLRESPLRQYQALTC